MPSTDLSTTLSTRPTTANTGLARSLAAVRGEPSERLC